MGAQLQLMQRPEAEWRHVWHQGTQDAHAGFRPPYETSIAEDDPGLLRPSHKSVPEQLVDRWRRFPCGL